ncbi:C-type lectin domain family 2 member B [Patagioenas fasciata monilis]|uniref:C-type lectin domain family 2 member B n=1 Tax=Patagioenas fasciata monilis TaxID=372326 RepID=A0A1V4K7H5_PATFA|nr:C-type lectin domain family 2 member B [Patagioenas fasciata monilis]
MGRWLTQTGLSDNQVGWKQALGADKMSWTQDRACDKHRDSPSHLPLGQGEKNRVCDNDGNMEECLDPQYRGASLKPELPGKRRSRRLLGKSCTLHAVYVVVLAVLMALVLALAVAVAAERVAGRAAIDPDRGEDTDTWSDRCWELSAVSQAEQGQGRVVQEELKEALGSQGEGASIHQEMPDKWCTLHTVYVVVLAVLVALVLALAVAVAMLSAGRDGASAAVGLCCPDNWVGYRNVCYYLSREEGSWEWSQERCSSLGASLAVIKRKWEMEFLSHLRGNIDYWVGLRRQDGRPEWVDGSSFNDTKRKSMYFKTATESEQLKYKKVLNSISICQLQLYCTLNARFSQVQQHSSRKWPKTHTRPVWTQCRHGQGAAGDALNFSEGSENC